eukprot:166954-Chlamydomonas_euryale.AAC.1
MLNVQGSQQTPFLRMNNPHMRKAFSRLGVKLSDEKWFQTEGLDMVYSEEEENTKKKIKKLV